jgi:biopolymer transport protein TolR
MRRPRKAINQINVVPYIDVMLVLLVIFMVTAPLITPGEIALPSVGSKLTTPVDPIEIRITSQGLALRIAGGAPARVSRDELLARVLATQGRNADQPVVISADKATRYEDVIGILDLLQRNGVHKVGLMARPQS